jgi:ketosteroid isomerase-like protein
MHPNEAAVRRYGQASAADDFATMASLQHPDWRWELPQSGEIFVGMANYIAMRTQRPEGRPRVEPLRIGGEGDHWWAEGIVHYADGVSWLALAILEFRDGKIWRERAYFMQPFPAQPWRAQWAQVIKPALS